MCCVFGFQAVIKHISGSGYESSEVMVTDEVELQRHHELEKLYRSTRASKVWTSSCSVKNHEIHT